MLIDDLHPDRADLRLTKIFAALSDPARIRAVQTLAQAGELACTRLQHKAGLDISRSTFSHHQKILREAGIIQVRVLGARRLLSIRRDDLEVRFPGLLELVTAYEQHDTASVGTTFDD
jgi:DNA-binding transcriptional ArsR family regulator